MSAAAPSSATTPGPSAPGPSAPGPSAPGPSARIPLHVAIIMDGNGRWAAARGQGRTAGHRRGGEAVKTAAQCAVRVGVRYLTLYGFSSENWSRPRDEVTTLMGLLDYYLRHEVGFLQEHRIRLQVIGDRGRFSAGLVKAIVEAERATAANGQLTLTIALSYGGRAEIAHAAQQIALDVLAGRCAIAEIDEATVARHLYTAGMPDPDLVIRTSGEQRVSNFLLWQTAYAEFVFLDTLWPDFSARDFEAAIAEFGRRERRYGAVSA